MRQKRGKALHGLAFDIVVLDIMMPGENGLDFATVLARAGNAVPILMLSARSRCFGPHSRFGNRQ